VTELEKVRDEEENTLRELRIFLREITVKLMSDRKFKEFHKPVDLEEVRTMTENTAIFQVKVSGHSL
jgi:predicted RNA-binding Zn ribbon-like protein